MRYLILAAILASCGSKTEIVETSQKFEGFYFCDNNSSIELITDFNNRVTFEVSNQSLNSINPKNDTLGTHPTIKEKDLVILGNRLLISPKNYNYSSSTGDIEEDERGSNVTGKRRTDIDLTRLNNGDLLINIKIFENEINKNINRVIVDRTINCFK